MGKKIKQVPAHHKVAHNIPIYSRRIQFYVSPEAALEDVPDNQDIAEARYGAMTLICEAEGDYGEFIVIVFKNDQYMSPEVVAHEATHAAFFTLGLAGVEVDWLNHEALAYLVGYITDQIDNFITRYHEAESAKTKKKGKKK